MKKIMIFCLFLLIFVAGTFAECENLEEKADLIITGKSYDVYKKPQYSFSMVLVSVDEIIRGSTELNQVAIALMDSGEVQAFEKREIVKVYLNYYPAQEGFFTLVCGVLGKEKLGEWKEEIPMPDIPEGLNNEWKEFESKYYSPKDTQVMVIWDYDNNVMKLINLGMYDAKPTDDYEKKSREFLLENKNLLGIDIDTLKLVGVKMPRTNALVSFVQYYNNIPVYGSYVKVTISSQDGRIITVSTNYFTHINVSTEPEISETEAVDIAVKRSGLNKSDTETGSFLIISPQESRLAYAVTVAAKEGLFGVLYFVDAHTGEIIKQQDLVVSEESIADGSPSSILEEYANTDKEGKINIILYVIGTIILVALIFSIIIYKRRRRATITD